MLTGPKAEGGIPVCGSECSGKSEGKPKAKGKGKTTPFDVLQAKYKARKGKVDRNEAGFASGTNTGIPSFGGGMTSRNDIPVKGAGADEKI